MSFFIHACKQVMTGQCFLFPQHSFVKRSGQFKSWFTVCKFVQSLSLLVHDFKLHASRPLIWCTYACVYHDQNLLLRDIRTVDDFNLIFPVGVVSKKRKLAVFINTD